MNDLHYFNESWITPSDSVLDADLCIYGASSAGVIAAIEAGEAREERRRFATRTIRRWADMILGQSAAIAACMAIDIGVAVQDVPYSQLRQQLDAAHQVLVF